MPTKDDLRLALRLSLAELNISMHSSTINGLVRHLLNHLDRFDQEDSLNSLASSPLL